MGNYQLLQIAPWVLLGSSPLGARFICHKLLRLLVPFALVGLLVSTIRLHEGVYAFALALQLITYALAILRTTRVRLGFLSRTADVALAFVVLNTAAALAFLYFISGKKIQWAR
jgi:hypothetical protein